MSNALSSQRVSTSALPVISSLILPGLGQMMNGEAVKGFMLLGAALILISQSPLFLSPIYMLIAVMAAVDAGLGQARRDRNNARLQDWA